MNYAKKEDVEAKKDEIIDINDIKVLVDPKATFYIAGTIMDFEVLFVSWLICVGVSVHCCFIKLNLFRKLNYHLNLLSRIQIPKENVDVVRVSMFKKCDCNFLV